MLEMNWSKFSGKVGVVSWLLFHIIWKITSYPKILTWKIELWIFSLFLIILKLLKTTVCLWNPLIFIRFWKCITIRKFDFYMPSTHHIANTDFSQVSLLCSNYGFSMNHYICSNYDVDNISMIYYSMTQII